MLQEEWFQVVDNLIESIIALSSEKEILMSKFKIKLGQTESIMNNNTLSSENLANHKLLIKEAIGKFNVEQNKRIQIETAKETLEKEIKFWLEDWDKLHSSPLIIVS